MLGSLKNSIMPHLLPSFRLQWAFLCSRYRGRFTVQPSLDVRKGPKYPSGEFCSPSTGSCKASDAQLRLAIHIPQVVFKNRLGHLNRGEDIGDQADGECDGEPANGAGPK